MFKRAVAKRKLPNSELRDTKINVEPKPIDWLIDKTRFYTHSFIHDTSYLPKQVAHYDYEFRSK